MKVRAYESMAVEPMLKWSLEKYKNLLAVGIVRAVNVTGRNLNNWDAYEESKKWEKVPAQPEHAVKVTDITFHTYKHGGLTHMQAVYFFEIEG